MRGIPGYWTNAIRPFAFKSKAIPTWESGQGIMLLAGFSYLKTRPDIVLPMGLFPGT